MRSIRFVVCALAALFSAAAIAAEHGVYVGASTGEASTDIEGGFDDIFDGEDSADKVFIGWRPFDWLAVEGGHVDLGRVRQTTNFADFSDFSLDQEGYDLFGVFLKEIGFVDLFAKVGAVRWSADVSGSTLAGFVAQSDEDTDFAWGLGAQVRLRKLAVRLEYEHFETHDLSGFDAPQLVSAGVAWQF